MNTHDDRLDMMFGPARKPAKERLKDHPKFKSCDFGIKEFNKNKRSRAFVEEANLKTSGKGKPQKPPKPPHPHDPTTPPTQPPPTPSGNNVLLLVFEGTVIKGTSWNYMTELVCAPSGLTIVEQEAVMAHMAEKFSPFNISVTMDPTVYNATPVANRGQVVYTETWEWFGQAGGAAFVGSFGTESSVCFVFTSLLGYIQKYVSEAGPHEAGHMCGCHHQAVCENGVKISEYNYGGNGEAPIMGVAYEQPVSKWIVGPSANNCVTQDDAAIIGAKLGVKK